MDYNTEFYKLLELAVTDDVALIRILDKIMTLINNNSIVNGKLDEDLKSEIIAITIEEVRKKDISAGSELSRGLLAQLVRARL